MNTPLDNFLSRLKGVKKTGHGKYKACCPSHEDKSPSLSISEGDKGQVLLHCFAGCSPVDVLESIGLGLVDLYPKDSNFAVGGKGLQSGRHSVPGWARPAARERLQHNLNELFLILTSMCPEGTPERERAAELAADSAELLSDPDDRPATPRMGAA